MNWHERLSAVRSKNVAQRTASKLPKLPKEGSDSFGSDPAGHFENVASLRERLMGVAAAQRIDEAHVHRLTDPDLMECVGLDEGQLGIYLHMLADTAERHAGRVPQGNVAPIQCQWCGPVWVHPEVAAVLPVVDGWPRALGCPWCFVRKAAE